MPLIGNGNTAVTCSRASKTHLLPCSVTTASPSGRWKRQSLTTSPPAACRQERAIRPPRGSACRGEEGRRRAWGLAISATTPSRGSRNSMRSRKWMRLHELPDAAAEAPARNATAQMQSRNLAAALTPQCAPPATPRSARPLISMNALLKRFKPPVSSPPRTGPSQMKQRPRYPDLLT